MQQLDPQALAPEVCALAREAGRAVMQVYERAGEPADAALVKHKDDGSPLTLADLAAHSIVAEGLRRLTREVPVVSEEDDASQVFRVPMGEFWLVDPLDGTREFLARNGEFTVNVALVRDGRPVWGVVYAPALDLMYWGGPGVGAFRQGASGVQAIQAAGPVLPGHACRVLASKSHLDDDTRDFIGRLGNAVLVQAGSSLKFCRLAEGSADLYPRFGPTCEWDTAAGQAVLEGAGGQVVDRHGQPLRYGKPGVLNPHFIASATQA